MAHQVRSLIFLPIIVAGFSVLGGVYGNGVQAAIDEPELDESGISVTGGSAGGSLPANPRTVSG